MFLAFVLYFLSAWAQQHQLLSESDSGIQGNGASFAPVVVSADGRYAAFVSEADNLVAGDTNGHADVFRVDLVNGGIERVSYTHDGGEPDRPCGVHVGGPQYLAHLDISGDGNLVVFTSGADNLLPTLDDDTRINVYMMNMTTDELTWVSWTSVGGGIRAGGENPQISDDGSTVVFESKYLSFVSERFGNADYDVFAYDTGSGNVTWISSLEGTEAEPGGDSHVDAVSPSGEVIAYRTESEGLHPHARIREPKAVIYEAGSGRPGSLFWGDERGFSFSQDLETWVFSTAESYADEDDDTASDVYLLDFRSGERTLVSYGGDLGNRSNPAFDGVVSAEGQHVAFVATGSFFDGVGNSNESVWWWEREDERLEMVNRPVVDGAFEGYAEGPDISFDGRIVTHRSNSAALVDGVGGTNAWGSLVGVVSTDLGVSVRTERITGERHRVIVELTNSGPHDLEGYELAVDLDGGEVVESEVPTLARCGVEGTVWSCEVATADPDAVVLAVDETVTFSVDVAWTGAGTRTVTASGSHAYADPDAGNDQASAEVELAAGTDLALSFVGDEGTVTYTIVNEGTEVAANVVLDFDLTVTGEGGYTGGVQSGVFESCELERGSGVRGRCSGIELAPGASFSVEVWTSRTSKKGGEVNQTATVSEETTTDTDPSDNTVSGEIGHIPGGCSSLGGAPALYGLLALLGAGLLRRRR